jgi:Leucine-rich repeat (LRR) protein
MQPTYQEIIAENLRTQNPVLNLTSHTFPNNTLPAELAKLTHLTELHLRCCNLENITVISSLKNLEILNLDGNQNLVDISCLSNLLNLKDLDLMDCWIDNLKPLSNLTCLIKLCLFENNINSVEFLSNLINLEFLVMENNGITDITPLANLKKNKKIVITTTSKYNWCKCAAKF